jgi:hypothetical protein
MTPKGLGLAAIAGLASGVVTLSVISGGLFGMLLAYVTPLPLVLIGLSFGFRPLLLASSIAVTVVALAALPAVPAFLVIGALPALVLTVIALQKPPKWEAGKWREPGEMLLVLTLGAVVMMMLMALSLPTDGKTIVEWLRDQAVPVIDAGLPNAAPEARTAIVSLWLAVMPALVGAGWLILTVVNGLFGQWAVSHAGHALRPTPAYLDFRLPLWLAGLAMAVGLGGLADGDVGYLARNLAIVLAVPFLLAGLADIHRVLRGKPQPRLRLAVFYGAFFALFSWAAMPVTAWGVVRQWKRSRRKDPALGQENSDGSHSA